MRQLADIVLTPIQLTALSELRRRILSEFEVEKVVLYGSAARGEAGAESDTPAHVPHADTRRPRRLSHLPDSKGRRESAPETDA